MTKPSVEEIKDLVVRYVAAQAEIKRLADYLREKFPAEIGKDALAVDVAIRLLNKVLAL